MSSSPYASSARVLDAAAAGTTVAGFEPVGRLLVDLGRTAPLGHGVALRSSAVAAATRVSRTGVRAVALQWLKPAVVLVSAIVVGAGVLLGTGGSTASNPTDVGPGAASARTDDGVAREVTDAANPAGDDDFPVTGGDQLTPSPLPVAGSGETGNGAIGSKASTTDPSGFTSPASTTVPRETPTSTSPPDETTTTTTITTTTTVPTTTTTEGEGEPPDPNGNNGNGNGNGVGNGKGNNGNGHGNGNRNGGSPDSE